MLFKLENFFPYQTRIFYRQVSTAVSHVYESRYNLKPYEWRTMAILGLENEFTANEIVEKSSMDKVSASRALALLKERGWILQRKNKLDGRSRLIKLSASGKKAYLDLVPPMLEVEQQLLSVFTPDEAAELRRLMRKLVDQRVG